MTILQRTQIMQQIYLHGVSLGLAKQYYFHGD